MLTRKKAPQQASHTHGGLEEDEEALEEVVVVVVNPGMCASSSYTMVTSGRSWVMGAIGSSMCKGDVWMFPRGNCGSCRSKDSDLLLFSVLNKDRSLSST